jgi:hypothetical protein
MAVEFESVIRILSQEAPDSWSKFRISFHIHQNIEQNKKIEKFLL